MADFDKNSVPGFQGFGAVASPIVSDTQGFFGFGAVKAINLVVLVVRPTNGGAVRGLTLTLRYNGTDYVSLYDPQFPFERLVPTGVDVIITASGGQYVTQAQTFQVAANQQVNVTVALAFASSYARIIKKRYF